MYKARRRAEASRPRPEVPLKLAVSHKAAALFTVGLAGEALGGLYVLGAGALRVLAGVLEDALVVIGVVGWLR